MHPRLARILQRYFGLNLYRVLARPLDPEPRAAAAGMRLALLGETELLGHCRDAGLELPAASARASLARGDLCVGALENDRLLGYAWFAFGATPESDGVWIDLDRRATYSYRHFVRPEARGRRIAAMLVTAADAACMQRGVSRYVTLIYTHNRASIRASLRSGAGSVGYAACLRLFGRALSWRSPGARREGLRFFRPQSNLSPFSFAMRRLASMLAATTSRN
jgi:GNAT superfamily N-acetyltransferase